MVLKGKVLKGEESMGVLAVMHKVQDPESGHRPFGHTRGKTAPVPGSKDIRRVSDSAWDNMNVA